MILPRSTGIGQDKNVAHLRRLYRSRILLVLVVAVLGLILSNRLLHERRGTLLVKTDLQSAYVVLNGTLTSFPAGAPIKKLRPDTYRVSVSLEGYLPEPRSTIVKINPGADVEVAFLLIPAPQETTATTAEIVAIPPDQPDPKIKSQSPPKSTTWKNPARETAPPGNTPRRSAGHSAEGEAYVRLATGRPRPLRPQGDEPDDPHRSSVD